MEDILNFLQDLLITGPDPGKVVECATNDTCVAVHAVASSLLVFFVLLTGFAYTTVLERRLIAWLQQRVGPNRAGPQGLLQPVADGVKLIFKEDVTPVHADRVVYWVAPVIKVIPALIILAVVPLGGPLVIPWFDGKWYRVAQGLVDVNVGVLWITSVASISVYGITMAGWASSNKYAMLGSLRSAASMISYELALGAALVVPAMIAGSLSVADIINSQTGNLIFNWNIFRNPLAGVILLIALIAEINRAPFDLPEAEQELVAGHMTEYSGMKFALFFMAEYINMIGISVIFSSMFLGGYHFILADKVPLLGPLWLTLKVIGLLSLMIWIRATLPRVRYDKLMALGWKVLLPLSLVAVAWTGVTIVLVEEYNDTSIYTGAAVVLFILMAVGAVLLGRETPEAQVVMGGEEEIVDLTDRNAGVFILQLVGSLIAAPFLLFRYTVDIVSNLAAGLGIDTGEEKATKS
ncbi:MAG: NADH-quinone oxidoreductase subunit NuoH [Anaerolineae bacterium]|nr:MAG: NADH-quinone oxidoreductase subunit NuoH [Anaerolineae bacterium]